MTTPWRKNGKVLRIGGQVIRCPSCPCAPPPAPCACPCSTWPPESWPCAGLLESYLTSLEIYSGSSGWGWRWSDQPVAAANTSCTWINTTADIETTIDGGSIWFPTTATIILRLSCSEWELGTFIVGLPLAKRLIGLTPPGSYEPFLSSNTGSAIVT